jgi:hypothetical protein
MAKIGKAHDLTGGFWVLPVLCWLVSGTG